MKNQLGKKLRKLLRPPSVRNVFNQSWRASEQCLEATSSAISAMRQHRVGVEGLEIIVNVNQFLSIFAYDLSVVHFELESLESGWQRSFHARVAALLLVEFMEDIGQLLGKDWRLAIEPFLKTDAKKEKLRQICKALVELRRRHEGELRKLRNLAIGHRDRDASLQLKTIRELDVELILGIVLEVTQWTTAMLLFYTGLTNDVAGFILKAKKIIENTCCHPP